MGQFGIAGVVGETATCGAPERVAAQRAHGAGRSGSITSTTLHALNRNPFDGADTQIAALLDKHSDLRVVVELRVREITRDELGSIQIGIPKVRTVKLAFSKLRMSQTCVTKIATMDASDCLTSYGVSQPGGEATHRESRAVQIGAAKVRGVELALRKLRIDESRATEVATVKARLHGTHPAEVAIAQVAERPFLDRKSVV